MNSTKIKLLEHTISVDFEPPGTWANDGMGRCSLSNCMIKVSSTMPHDSQCSIFLHELTHMIADMQGIELTEQSIDGMSLGMLSFIRNNAQFITDNLMDRTSILTSHSQGGLRRLRDELSDFIDKEALTEAQLKYNAGKDKDEEYEHELDKTVRGKLRGKLSEAKRRILQEEV